MKKLKNILVILTSVLIFASFTTAIPAYAVLEEGRNSSTRATVEIGVYPDGTVGLSLDYFYNYTSSWMYYSGPTRIHSEVETSRQNELTVVNTSETLKFSEEQASQFPLNSTMVSITQEYSQEILNCKISGSITFPTKWTGYLPGYPHRTYIDFSIFPFNSTDLTINSLYSNGRYNGTLSIHLIPGLTLGDIELQIEGNTTHTIISDHLTVFYNNTLPIGGFTPINRTMIQEISQNKTYIDQMLFEMTGGLVKCEVYNVTISPVDENSDTIYLQIILRNNLVDILAKIYQKILQSFYGSYYGYPLSEQIINISKDLANITIECFKNARLELTYTSSARTVKFDADLSANLEEIWNKSKMIADDLTYDVPLEIKQKIMQFFEIKYASMQSYTDSLSYQNGQIEHSGTYIFEGDISEELSLLKGLYIYLMVASTPYPPPSWQIDFINETQIVDMDNFKFYFDQNSTANTQLVSLSFEGIKIAPLIDAINTTHFKLERFFNLTHSPYEPPRRNEMLKIIVKGECNGTHTIIPIIDPEKVPEPDNILSGNIFIWNNQSLSGLKELIFKIYGGFAQYIDKESVSPEKPCTINAIENANCKINVNDVEKDAVMIIQNISLPENVSPPPETFKLIGKYVQIKTEKGEEISGNFTIKMFYDPEELAELGIDERNLKIFNWNTEENAWVPMETHLNSDEHYVWTNVDHLSIWAIMGQAAKPIWTETWFIITISCVIITILAIAMFLARRHKKSNN